MHFVFLFCVLFLLFAIVSAFWDTGTTTVEYIITDTTPRQSFFRWQESRSTWMGVFYPFWDWYTMYYNRRTSVVAGVSIDFICLTTGSILNRRTILTAANVMDPWYNRQRDLRIWALGNYGHHKTPYRYRVWRTTRLLPKSLNPEHWHGPRGIHSPRHDVCLIHTLDQMFIYPFLSKGGMYACKSFLPWRHSPFTSDVWYTGSGYEYALHVKENYKIFYTRIKLNNVVDCSKYLPKYWGKFVCMKSFKSYYGLQNGGGLHVARDRIDFTFGMGSFEIRYNEDRILVFTDLRYYIDWLYLYGKIYPGEYYEYAYPQWGVSLGMIYNSIYGNAPTIPTFQPVNDWWPLGRK